MSAVASLSAQLPLFAQGGVPGPVHTWPVFDAADLDRLAEGLATLSSRDQERRNKQLIERLRQRGPQRCIDLPADVVPQLQALQRRLPHFSGVVEQVLAEVALARHARRPLQMLPLLLVGPPGVGKSYFAQALAQALGLPLYRLAMDGAQSAAQLTGSAAFWSNTQTGLIFEALALGDHLSPIVLLDEIDKAPRHAQYDPLAPLHGLLEPSTAGHFEDASLALPLDARFVVWIATANEAQALDAPLRSRFAVQEIAAPSREQARTIAQGLLSEQMREFGLDWSVREEVVERLSRVTPRQQSQWIRLALGRALLRQAQEVTAEDLPAAQAPDSRVPMGFVPVG